MTYRQIAEVSITRGPRCFYVTWSENGATRDREFATFAAAREFARSLKS
jgi:hypothetical protein